MPSGKNVCPSFWLLLFTIVLFPFAGLKCQLIQRIFKIDTASQGFYDTFDTLSNNRVYISEKLTSPTLVNADGSHQITYRSNSNYNLGIGHTYRYLTLNIAASFEFINHDDDIRGRTRYLDLHTQAVGRPYIIDLYGQFYKGVYILPDNGSLPKGQPYMTRPDIYTQQIGFSSYFVPNWRKFSYAAAITQRDWQKKSAGSPLYGVEFFTGKIKGDSAIIPYDREQFFSHPDIFKMNFVELGIGLGYAYTLVIAKHWFIHASAIPSLSAGYSQEYEGENVDGFFYLRPNFLIRPSIGYNSRGFNCSLYWFASRVTSGSNNGSYRINTSNLRLTFAHRLKPKPRMQKFYDQLF